MNSDIVVFLLVALFWIVSQAIAWLGRRARPMDADLEQATPPGQNRKGTLQEALRDLAQQMGVDVEMSPVEPPAVAQPNGSGSEHRRTVSETHPTASETRMSKAEHRRTPSEAQRTSSEEVWSVQEHEWSQSEHVRGDLEVSAIPKLDTHGQTESSRFVERLRAELTSQDRSALARAIVLREVLGPPVSLRPPSDRF